MIRLIVLIMMFVIIFTVTVSIADEPEKIEKVVVTGIGINADKARQNAIRNAVEQVVGTFVSSDTMVKDSALIKDEILSYSGGFVKESRILSTEKDDDLIKVKLEALVVATKLKRKIQALNIAVKKVDGQSLFGEAISKAMTAKSGQEQLLQIFLKYPQAAYTTEVGKPVIMSVDHETNKAKIKLNLKIHLDKQFIDELESVLKAISYQKLVNKTFDVYANYGVGSIYSLRKKGDIVLMFTNNDMLAEDMAASAYFVDVGESFLNKRNVINDLISHHESFEPELVINLCDSADNILAVISRKMPIAWTNNIKFRRDNGYTSILSASNAHNARHDLLFVPSKTDTIDVEFKADISQLKNVTSFKVNFKPYVQ